MKKLAFLFFCFTIGKSLQKKSKIWHLFLNWVDFQNQAVLRGHVGQTWFLCDKMYNKTIPSHQTSVICPLKKTAFSTRSAQLQNILLGWPGVLPSPSGHKVFFQVQVVSRVWAMAGISVERRETRLSHTTAHMVREWQYQIGGGW